MRLSYLAVTTRHVSQTLKCMAPQWTAAGAVRPRATCPVIAAFVTDDTCPSQIGAKPEKLRQKFACGDPMRVGPALLAGNAKTCPALATLCSNSQIGVYGRERGAVGATGRFGEPPVGGAGGGGQRRPRAGAWRQPISARFGPLPLQTGTENAQELIPLMNSPGWSLVPVQAGGRPASQLGRDVWDRKIGRWSLARVCKPTL